MAITRSIVSLHGLVTPDTALLNRCVQDVTIRQMTAFRVG